MGDVVELLPRGAQEFTALTFTCTCQRCGRPVRWINSDDPVGRSRWERRVVVQCSLPLCGWSAKVTVQLDELGVPKGAA